MHLANSRRISRSLPTFVIMLTVCLSFAACNTIKEVEENALADTLQKKTLQGIKRECHLKEARQLLEEALATGCTALLDDVQYHLAESLENASALQDLLPPGMTLYEVEQALHLKEAREGLRSALHDGRTLDLYAVRGHLVGSGRDESALKDLLPAGKTLREVERKLDLKEAGGWLKKSMGPDGKVLDFYSIRHYLYRSGWNESALKDLLPTGKTLDDMENEFRNRPERVPRDLKGSAPYADLNVYMDHGMFFFR